MSGVDAIAACRITVCGIDELGGHCGTGVSHVLSILDPDWPVPKALAAFGRYRRLELRFHDVIEDNDDDTVPPHEEHVAALLAFGRNLVAGPAPAAHLLVHCHAGVSRSTAAMALILAQGRPGIPAGRIFAEILRLRPQAWPNLRVVEMGDQLLGRRGELIAAAHEVYRGHLASRPELAEQMRDGGRGREVAGAQEPPV
jgi:predicted protein tyrosine phosphatase